MYARESQLDAVRNATRARVHPDSLEHVQEALRSIESFCPLLNIPGAVTADADLRPGQVVLTDERKARWGE